MSDNLIKRSDAMRVALWFGTSELKYSRQFVKRRVMEIPIAEPKCGEWIYTMNPLRLNDEWECNKCGYLSFTKTNYCGHCGSRMKGANDE